MSIKRTLTVTPFALLVTLLLLTLMIALIESNNAVNEKVKRTKLPDIFMPDVDVVEAKIIEKPEKPEVDETPPPEVPEQDFDKMDGDSNVGSIAAPDGVSGDIDISMGTGLSASDGEYLPIVKVAPVYPSRAAQRGVQGDVVIEYIVTTSGSVRDPRVVSSDSSLLNNAALKSASKYKYKPRVVDGVPVEVPGVRTIIKFRLEG